MRRRREKIWQLPIGGAGGGGGGGEQISEKAKHFKLKTLAPARGRLKIELGPWQSIQVGLILTLVLSVQSSIALGPRTSRQVNSRPGDGPTKTLELIQRQANTRSSSYAAPDDNNDDGDETEAYTTPATSGRLPAELVASEPAAPSQNSNQFMATLENDYQTAADLAYNFPLISSSSTLNESSNESCYEYENIVKGRPSLGASYAFIGAYGLIFLLGLSGNLLTLYVLFSKGSRCSAQDILLGNLAISDVMLCVFAIPITPKYLVWDHYWKMGEILCKLVSATQSVSVYMSTYSLIVIGYIRYRLIVHPLGEAMSKRRSILYCLGTLIVACGFTYLYVRKVRVAPDYCEIKFCDEDWQGNDRFYFSLFTCSCQLSIPLLAVIFFYFNIYRRLDHRITGGGGGGGGGVARNIRATSGLGNQKPIADQDRANHANSQANNNQNGRSVLEIRQSRQREKERRMRRMNKRLIWVVCIFAFSWFPLNLYNLLSDYYEYLANWPYITYAFLVTHLIACSSVVWNPFLYAWMSDSFKDDLRRATPECMRTSNWLKTCLNEPSAASGLHGPGGGAGGGGAGAGVGGCGSPTSIVMVSTNGHHLHHHHHHTANNGPAGKGLRAAGFGKGVANDGGVAAELNTPTNKTGSNPNGLAEVGGLTAAAAEELLQTRLTDQIAEIRSNEPVTETRQTICCSAGQRQLEQAVGERNRLNKSLDEIVSSQEELCDEEEEEDEPCRCLEVEGNKIGSQPEGAGQHYYIEICEERAAERRHLSSSGSGGGGGGGDSNAFASEISSRPASIKLSGPKETSANNGIQHWA